MIISVPYGAIESIPKKVFTNLSSDAIVVDTGNFYPEMHDDAILKSIKEKSTQTPESVAKTERRLWEILQI